MFAAGKAVSSADPTDAQFNYVTMLLHGDGTNGAQNNTFLDSSTNAFTITRNGNTTQGTFTPYGSNWSNYFDGSSVLQVAQSSGAISNITQGDFTLEAWIFPTATPASRAGISCCRTNGGNNGWMFSYNSSNKILFWYGSGAFLTITSATSAPLNTWTHVAVTRSSSTYKMYINGTLDATVTGVSNGITNTVNALLGSEENYANKYTGYTSNLRVVDGSVLYTTTFTPSTTPLTAVSGTVLLTAQSNRFLDNSSNAFAESVYTGTPSVQRFSPFSPTTAYSTSVIGGSGYFDGSTAYLNTSQNSAFTFDATFTVEFWVYITNNQNTDLIGTANNVAYIGSGNSGWIISYLTSGGIRFGYQSNNSWGPDANLGMTPTLNSWNHIAVVRSGSTITGYLNGVAGSTPITSSATFTSNLYGVYVGAGAGNNNAKLGGNVSNLRIVKGTAVYTSSFTPSTTPLTAITNTSLLLSYTNAGILDNAMMNNLETVGNAQISTSVKKYGTGSIYLDGTGDWLLGRVSPNLSFGTGNFTIEGWGYVTSVDGTYRCIVTIGTPVEIYARAGTIEVYFNDSDDSTSYIVNNMTGPASSVSANTWFHFAVVRNGTTFTAYVNGVAGTSVTGVSAQVALSAYPFALGVYLPTLAYPFTGYIDDFRITKGYARYTANFTAPTTAFADKG